MSGCSHPKTSSPFTIPLGRGHPLASTEVGLSRNRNRGGHRYIYNTKRVPGGFDHLAYIFCIAPLPFLSGESWRGPSQSAKTPPRYLLGVTRMGLPDGLVAREGGRLLGGPHLSAVARVVLSYPRENNDSHSHGRWRHLYIARFQYVHRH